MDFSLDFFPLRLGFWRPTWHYVGSLFPSKSAPRWWKHSLWKNTYIFLRKFVDFTLSRAAPGAPRAAPGAPGPSKTAPKSNFLHFWPLLETGAAVSAGGALQSAAPGWRVGSLVTVSVPDMEGLAPPYLPGHHASAADPCIKLSFSDLETHPKRI